MLLEVSNMETQAQQNTNDEGSIRSLSRKSSDFSVDAQRVGYCIDAYPKNRRYAQLQLNAMFASLVSLYEKVFETQWSYFKRVYDNFGMVNANANESKLNLARIYISHWFLDLFASVKASVEKLTPVAYTELFTERVINSSFEYDVFLAHLNSCIRPTHVVGCYEDSMFIPRFTTHFDMSNNNPWDIAGFTVNYTWMKAIVRAIKDKRAGWRTAKLSNETVGRPFWLFDWHSEDRVCSWFPRDGNYTNEDTMYAYLIGVSCTPHLAHTDRDNWQRVADNVNWETFDYRTVVRQRPRRYFGAYEVDTFSHRDEKFTSDPEDDEPLETGRSLLRKRPRISGRMESDPTQVSGSSSGAARMESDDTEKTFKMMQLVTYLYYSRIISYVDADERLSVLLGLIIDEQAHHV